MAYAKQKFDEKPQAFRVTKKEITYEYVPVLGGLLGWWRKAEESRLCETIELHLKHSLRSYDRVVINGVEIPLPKEALTEKDL